MTTEIQRACESLLLGIQLLENCNSTDKENAFSALKIALEQAEEPLSAIKLIDDAVLQYPFLTPFTEVIVDFIIIEHLNIKEKQDEDYIESAEWAELEDATIDRGTEALNMFLYLQEAKDFQVIPNLDDFLEEFLLISEDGFQEEHEIYEPLIQFRDTIDLPIDEMMNTISKEGNGSEIEGVIVPIMVFLKYPNKKDVAQKALLNYSDKENLTDLPLTLAFYGFYNT